MTDASEVHILPLYDSRVIPDDIPSFLEDMLPLIEVDEHNLAMLFEATTSHELDHTNNQHLAILPLPSSPLTPQQEVLVGCPVEEECSHISRSRQGAGLRCVRTSFKNILTTIVKKLGSLTFSRRAAGASSESVSTNFSQSTKASINTMSCNHDSIEDADEKEPDEAQWTRPDFTITTVDATFLEDVYLALELAERLRDTCSDIEGVPSDDRDCFECRSECLLEEDIAANDSKRVAAPLFTEAEASTQPTKIQHLYTSTKVKTKKIRLVEFLSKLKR
ncbi:hypothetical protein AcV5_009979 [Taiwanofungus camphoratus]|nr:hypothetical protein AcV5_009979 [Antrodia cinnamomea]KAI0945863.1 hypothetical protein AcV7_009987 [Antrodia cinnamomea]